MMISLDKTYRTRNGLEVRVFMTDNPYPYPIMGAVRFSDGQWIPAKWAKDGCYTLEQDLIHPMDLIEVKPQRTGWINIYDNSVHKTREIADQAAGSYHRIACIQVTFTEGEGL